jgi:ComF family protein
MLKMCKMLVNIVVDWLIPRSGRVMELESLGASGLYEKIPLADNEKLLAEQKTGVEVWAIFNYRNALCRQAIWEIKFRGNKKLIADFAQILYEKILEDWAEEAVFEGVGVAPDSWMDGESLRVVRGRPAILVPMPSARARRRERGFNQCELIVQKIIELDRARGQNNFVCAKNILYKKVETAHQARAKNRQERLNNMKGVFAVRDFKSEDGARRFILIDDVITTGATMTEAVRALREAGATKISAYTLAH